MKHDMGFNISFNLGPVHCELPIANNNMLGQEDKNDV